MKRHLQIESIVPRLSKMWINFGVFSSVLLLASGCLEQSHRGSRTENSGTITTVTLAKPKATTANGEKPQGESAASPATPDSETPNNENAGTQNEEAAKPAIVKLIAPVGATKKLQELKDGQNYTSYEKFHEIMSGIQTTRENQISKAFMGMQVKRCEANQTPVTDCIIFVEQAVATGFAVGDTQHIATVFHFVRRSINLLRRQLKTNFTTLDSTKEHSLPILVLNVNNEPIDVGEIHISDLPERLLPIINSDEELSSLNSLVDFALLEITQPLPHFLTTAKKIQGETLSIFGFDQGLNLKLVRDQLDTVQNGLQREGKSIPDSTSPEDAELWKSEVFSSRKQTGPGFSGGPVLNSRGEVIGIHQSSNNKIPVSYGTSIEFFLNSAP